MPDLEIPLLVNTVFQMLLKTEGVQQLASLQVQGQQRLDTRIATAVSAVVQEMLAERRDAKQIEAAKDDAATDRRPDTHADLPGQPGSQDNGFATGVEVTQTAVPGDLNKTAGETESGHEVSTASDHTAGAESDHTAQVAAENKLQEPQIQQRALDTIDEFRQEIVSRAEYLGKLTQDELNGVILSLVKIQPIDESMVKSESLDDQWQSVQAQLESDVAQQVDALSQVARQVEGKWPQVAAEDLATRLVDKAALIDLAGMERTVTESLRHGNPPTVTTLLDERRTVAEELDRQHSQQQARPSSKRHHAIQSLEHKQRELEFDSRLAIGLLQHDVAQQIEASRQALASDLQQLPENSTARKSGEAVLKIYSPAADTGPEVRAALVDFYDAVANKHSYERAGELLDKVLDAHDSRLFEYVKNFPKDPGGVIVAALSEEQDIRERAQREIQRALDGETDQRVGRVSSWGREVKQSRPDLDYQQTVDYHAQMRLENMFKVFQLVADLKDRGLVSQNDPVRVPDGGASFQLGHGSVEDRTAAAHKLPAQISIGVDHSGLAGMPERRLDHLVPDQDDVLKLAVRGWFGTTTETPLCVNAVDSLWEEKGLREAFRGAIEYIVQQSEAANRQAVLKEAFERFKDDALTALTLASRHNEDRRHATASAELRQDPRCLTPDDRDQMARVIAEYQRMLADMEFEKLRDSVKGLQV